MRTAPQQSDKGIPDVSAQARKFQIVWQGQRISIGGTSAVTPTFAGLVALLNDARLAAPRSEVIDGVNPGCGTPGFKATKGWDPVTGLGTPDFKKLMKTVTGTWD
ncbi:peptidase S8/S53 domain-containing protein [Mycena olivaceomarginata]|nr:peptidase S8/S53 domain-containing protein [Mycena olivaceomarginata]